MLSQLQSLEENGYIPPRASAAVSTPDMAQMQRMMDDRFSFKPRRAAMLLNEFQRQEGRQGMMVATGIGTVGNMEDDEIAGIIGNNNGEIQFNVQDGFGINSNSENQRTAWEFIKFLSSDAVRQSMRLMGLPTHIEAFEERAELSVTGSLFGFDADEMDAADRKIFDAYVAKVEYFTNQLNTFASTDTMIADIVFTEVSEFFDGSRTAEDVAQTLQSRINLFLNE
jgi:ABC-type glycerol-3-phosphate transport system substrate-binding protein